MKEQIEKQAIEEMSKIACVGFREGDCENCKSVGICSSYTISTKLYNAGYRKQEWISVDEKLPEKSKTLLCTDGIYIGTVYYSGKFGFEDYAPFDKITHWMPLPKPPKMKGGAE